LADIRDHQQATNSKGEVYFLTKSSNSAGRGMRLHGYPEGLTT